MKIGLYCSIDCGVVHDLSIDYIAVDGGLVHLINQNIKPIEVIGDMDSLNDHSLLKDFNVQYFSPIKDDTDTALAIKHVIDLGYDEIDLYGVTKNRLDHFLAVIALIRQYEDYKITIYDEYNKISLLKPGYHCIKKDGYQYFSVFSFEDTMVSLSHCLYPLESYCLKSHDPLCVSNSMDEYAYVENDKTLLLIQSD